jgi:putative oxidoreductase
MSNNFTGPITRLHTLFVWVCNSLQPLFLLFIRVYWGLQFGVNGWHKLHGLSNLTSFFQSLGLPAPAFTAAFVASFEFVGGFLLAFGLLSRIAALGIFIDMTTAYLTADKDAFTAFFSDPNKFVAADPFIFWFVGLIILIFGPGKFALDTLIARNQHKSEPANT